MTPELESLAQQLIEAGEKADWMQVALNCSYGPPCFHFEADRGKFCLRAKTWFGHDGDPHNYVSLGDLIRAFREELKTVLDRESASQKRHDDKMEQVEGQLKQARRDAQK